HPPPSLFPYTTLFRSLHLERVWASTAVLLFLVDCYRRHRTVVGISAAGNRSSQTLAAAPRPPRCVRGFRLGVGGGRHCLLFVFRSEEHTSELQSLRHL